MWDWAAFFHYADSAFLLEGAAMTLGISVASILLGLLCGLVAALMRMSARPWLNRPARCYIWLMRGTPVLVQLIIIFTGLPQLGIKFTVVQAAIIGLGVNEGASAGPLGQFEASRALGLSTTQGMRLVILPQAIRVVIPPLGNAFNGLMKTSSLASVISMDELLRRSQMLIQINFKVLEIFVVAALYYLALTTLWGLVQGWLERRFARGMAASERRTAPHLDLALSLPAPDAT